MKKALAPGLFISGIVLTAYGINAVNSFSSDVSRFLSGAPTDRAIWLLVGGIIAVVAGLVLLLRQ